MRSAAAGPFLSAPSVPHLGLGLASLGRPGYINLGHGSDIKTKTVDEMRAQCWEVLDAAFQSGVRYFDAARRCVVQCSLSMLEAQRKNATSLNSVIPFLCAVMARLKSFYLDG